MNHTSDEKKFRNEILKAYEAKILKHRRVKWRILWEYI